MLESIPLIPLCLRKCFLDEFPFVFWNQCILYQCFPANLSICKKFLYINSASCPLQNPVFPRNFFLKVVEYLTVRNWIRITLTWIPVFTITCRLCTNDRFVSFCSCFPPSFLFLLIPCFGLSHNNIRICLSTGDRHNCAEDKGLWNSQHFLLPLKSSKTRQSWAPKQFVNKAHESEMPSQISSAIRTVTLRFPQDNEMSFTFQGPPTNGDSNPVPADEPVIKIL